MKSVFRRPGGSLAARRPSGHRGANKGLSPTGWLRYHPKSLPRPAGPDDHACSRPLCAQDDEITGRMGGRESGGAGRPFVWHGQCGRVRHRRLHASAWGPASPAAMLSLGPPLYAKLPFSLSRTDFHVSSSTILVAAPSACGQSRCACQVGSP